MTLPEECRYLHHEISLVDTSFADSKEKEEKGYQKAKNSVKLKTHMPSREN